MERSSATAPIIMINRTISVNIRTTPRSRGRGRRFMASRSSGQQQHVAHRNGELEDPIAVVLIVGAQRYALLQGCASPVCQPLEECESCRRNLILVVVVAAQDQRN